MAKVNTTLASALTVDAEVIVVASATSFAAGRIVQIGKEQMQVTKGYVSGVTVPVKRGWNGTAPSVYVASTPLTHMLAEDMVATTPQQVNTLPQSMTVDFNTYVAAGAIAFGAARWTFAQILGTSAIAMTLASPTIDQDGYLVTVIGAGKSTSTLTVNTGTVGIGNAGSGYDVLTFQAAGQLGITFVASNGFWVTIHPPITGTTTSISMAIA